MDVDICKYLAYDPEIGTFTWLLKSGTRGTKGSSAGTVTPYGYVAIYFRKKRYLAHRLAFLIMDGAFPGKGVEVDHIDGIRDNNSWAKLRTCSKYENQQNRKLGIDNKSGLIGVSKCRDKWHSQISYQGKKYHLGYYSTKEEAHQVYLDKKASLHTFNPVPRFLHE